MSLSSSSSMISLNSWIPFNALKRTKFVSTKPAFSTSRCLGGGNRSRARNLSPHFRTAAILLEWRATDLWYLSREYRPEWPTDDTIERPSAVCQSFWMAETSMCMKCNRTPNSVIQRAWLRDMWMISANLPILYDEMGIMKIRKYWMVTDLLFTSWNSTYRSETNSCSPLLIRRKDL